MGLINQYNQRLRKRYLEVARTGCRKFDFLGGRRSGKSYLIEQILLGRLLRGDVISVATMTGEQGRLGSYADVCDIIAGSPEVQQYLEVLKSPRQINCVNGGRMFFNSYQDPERAKGIACDWLYINEANNFTERQYIDLSASVRKGVFADRNPNTQCWTENNSFALIHSTWQDNEYLTDEQRRWFELLYEKAHADGATAADWYYYKVYYLGEYSELKGDIFTPNNIKKCAPEDVPNDLDIVIIFSDPSARVGNDYHATVMAAFCKRESKIYILDTDSRNIGDDYEMAMMLQEWSRRRDRVKVYIETNGLGEGFYRYCRSYNIPIVPYCSNAKKERRIMDNYHTITSRVVFVENDHLQPFLEQIYTFAGEGGKCEHDDNIDAVNSAVTILKPYIDYTKNRNL